MGENMTQQNIENGMDENKEVVDQLKPTTKELPQYRYLIVEYCFKDDSYDGEKHILGSYPSIGVARLNAGIYIKDNAKRMKKRYRFWQVKVQREKIYFDINKRVQ